MKILIIANHLLTAKIASGGDRVFVEMAKRWRRWGAKIFLVAPEVGFSNVASEIGVEKTVVIPPSPFDQLQGKAIWAILPLYISRTFRLLGSVAFSGLPRFTQGTPASFIKLKERTLTFRSADRSTAFDVLYTPGDFFCDVVPAFYLKRKIGVRWIANIYHINEPPFVRKGNGFLATSASFLLQRFSFSLIRRGADIIFLNNQEVKNGLVRMGFAPQKMFVTGLGGVDLKKLKIENCKLKIFDGCFLGRLNPTKGIFDLPKVWQKVVQEIPVAKLVMIGSGEKWMAELRSQIKSLGLDKSIKITGFVDEEEKYKLLSQSQVFVFPSYEEGWGMAVAEAMAAGLPVVAYDLPTYKEVFPDALLTVKTGDVGAMSRPILKLLQDKSAYEVWQKRGAAVVRRYDLDTIARQQWEIIRFLF